MTERVSLAAGVVQGLCDQIESLRAGVTLETETASELATRVARTRAGLVGAVSVATVASAVGDLCEVLRDLGREADPAQIEGLGSAALPGLTGALPVTSSPAVTMALDFARAAVACVEAALLAEVAVAVAEQSYGDRPTAQAAAGRLAALADASLERVAEQGGEEIWRAASEAVRQGIDHLGRGALDLKPVVLVESMRSLPSTVLAWRLYGDPERAEELVARNGVTTSLFMPTSFEALAS
jgi:prophage DNA circulation protein